MKKLFLFLLAFISLSASAQIYQAQNGYGFQYKRLKIDSTLHVPTFNGAPNLRNSVDSGNAAIAFDSANNKVYFYNPKTKTWSTISATASDITGLISAGSNITITGTGTSGDPYVINSTGGGSGNTKYILQGYGTIIDSSDANHYTVSIDTTRLKDSLYAGRGIKVDTTTYPNHTLLVVDSNYVRDTSLHLDGGTINQVLKKNSSTNGDWSWQDESGSGSIDTSHLSDRIDANAANISTNTSNIAANTTTIAGKQDAITLTTTGTSGAATLSGSTLNIPQYSGGSSADTISATPKYINIIQSGQSNAWGGSGPTAYDTAANPRVLIWQHAQATPAWVVAHINQRPFRTAGYNSVDGTATRDDLNGSANSAFYLAKKIADENPNDTVRIILAIGDGRSISYWFNGTTRGQYTDSILVRGNASGIDHTDVFVWDQGESDGSTTDATYKSRFDSIKATLRRQSWFSPTTPIVVSGLPQTAYGASPASATYRDSTLKKMNYDNDQWTAYGNTDSLSIATDNIHWSASSLDTLGRTRYYTAWKTMPYRNGVGSAAGSDNEVQYNKYGALASSSTFRYSPTGIQATSRQTGLEVKPVFTRRFTGDSLIFADLSGSYDLGSFPASPFVKMLKFGPTFWNSDSLWNISIGSGNSALPAGGNTFYVGNNAGNASTANNSVGIGPNALAGANGANSFAAGNGAGFGAGTSINAFGWGALQATGVTYTNAFNYSSGKSSTASYGNYFGVSTGMYNAAPYSNLIGTYVGYGSNASHLTGRNLSMIGTGITAPLNNSVDLFNAGNVLYVTHTLYSTSGSVSLQRGVGKLGVNNPNPQGQITMSPGDSVAGMAPIVIPFTKLTITGGNDGTTYDTLFFADQTYPPFGDSSSITVTGVTPSAYNGTWRVLNCTSTYVVYSNSGAAGAVTVNGTIQQGKFLTNLKDGAIERGDSTGIAFSSGTGTNLQRNFLQKGRSGTATLSSGTVTVSTSYVRANSRIFVFVDTPAGTQGFLSAPSTSIVSGTSFVINSTSATESSNVYWVVLNQ